MKTESLIKEHLDSLRTVLIDQIRDLISTRKGNKINMDVVYIQHIDAADEAGDEIYCGTEEKNKLWIFYLEEMPVESLLQFCTLLKEEREKFPSSQVKKKKKWK